MVAVHTAIKLNNVLGNGGTVNVELFMPNIFWCNSILYKVPKEMFRLKITFTMPFGGNIITNTQSDTGVAITCFIWQILCITYTYTGIR